MPSASAACSVPVWRAWRLRLVLLFAVVAIPGATRGTRGASQTNGKQDTGSWETREGSARLQ